MVKVPVEVKEVLSNQKILPVATASSEGVPNVIFVAIWKFIDDETLLLVDNFFKKTRKNLEENPSVAIVGFDGEMPNFRSYQVKGRAEITTSGDHFDEASEMSRSKELQAKAAVIVHIEEIYNAAPGPDAGAQIA
ncbi:MAG: pyridoxamine 5'-phosphate oxidase family protein [Methanosarcinales archaeon]